MFSVIFCVILHLISKEDKSISFFIFKNKTSFQNITVNENGYNQKR